MKDRGALSIQQGEIPLDFSHRELVMESAVSVGQFPGGWPWAADVRAANAADAGRFNQFEPMLHTL